MFEKIKNTNFKEKAKKLLITAIIVIVACGALNAIMFRTQISQYHAWETQQEQSAQVIQDHTFEGHHFEEDHHYDEHHNNGMNGTYEYHDSGKMNIEDLVRSGVISKPSTAAVVVWNISKVLVVLLFVAYWLMVASWLYKAAFLTDMNPTLWFVLGLIGNLITVVVFLIVRSTKVKCPNCGTYQKAAPYCKKCGAKLQNVCPKCGKVCDAKAKFCPNCGTPLNNDDPDVIDAETTTKTDATQTA